MRARAFEAIAGYVIVVLGFFYFAFALSIVQSVDWTSVLSAALWIAPIGAFVGYAAADIRELER